MMRFTIYCVCFVSLAFLFGCREGHRQKEHTIQTLSSVEVRVQTVSKQEALLQTEVIGTVQPVDKAVVAAKVTGTIEEIPVVLGSKVKAGDLLVKISAREISAKVIQAQAQLEQVRRNLEREQKLLEKKAATSESVKSLQDMYRVAEAVHLEAETMLGYTIITAPFDGLITSKNTNVGDLATPGTPLLQLEDNRKHQVVIFVPESLILQIESGAILSIHVPSAELNIQGTVAEIAPTADPLSRTSAVKINIGAAPLIRSGQFARVAIPYHSKNTLFVPDTAVLSFGQMEKIFVIKENTATLRLVRTGAVVEGKVEILAGLEPDETIVVSDIAKLVDGQPVTIEQ